MSNLRKQEFNDDGVEQSNVEDCDDSSSISSGGETSSVRSDGSLRESGGSRSEVGLTERLTDIFVGHGDGDLLLQQNDRENTVLQWLQALDFQVIGACRADERLKPMLKMNVSSGLAEDRLLEHLIQHFEPSEVGMLARCFCIPLVSIRVGKINKQGNLLCPTPTRGDLNLTLSPTSDLRLSFIGDDGQMERLFSLSNKSQSSAVVVEEIAADSSGRSFQIRISDSRVFYFWCSEKSKLLGIELLAKMKDLLKKRPSVAVLTGISESRLDCFATHLHAYLMGSAVCNGKGNSPCSASPSLDSSLNLCDATQSAQTVPLSTKSPRYRHISSQSAKLNIYQGSLSPRSGSFKEGLPKSLSSLRNAAREKLRRRGDCHLQVVDNLAAVLPVGDNAYGSRQNENGKLLDIKSSESSTSSLLESLGKLAVPPTLSAMSQVPSLSPQLFSPYYCWCPPGTQQSVVPSQITSSSVGIPRLPSLSSLLSAPPSFLTPTSALDRTDVPSLDFPTFLPIPSSHFLPIPSSQQIPTFTPLMCDPIVHIPVIDICSSGQGYLVSAGPTMTTTIPPLHPKLVSPLIAETESLVEKGARETLRLLISTSSQANNQLMDVLPAVLTNSGEQQNIFVTGSRGLYTGVRDVDAIASSIAAMSLASLSGTSIGDRVSNKCSCDKLDASAEGSGGMGGSYSDAGGPPL
ncbi:hypothetical protein HS088_TW13G01371 [Tripterygium wilfordii]|uniref:Uncharacterized protein n=1 Tax=Tripterygium wilfordii TaxID=458696 RepID=A0A7J7CWF7_TRIWF|nr:uncharacterized protein LOC120013173 [Tripterygium wilfordii]KAF5738472.1 hypothetical protein HS088_TW13G01371 [Tripterygium wilfordii]